MTTDALFGPDGTQLPEPLPVLPDPLVAPGTAHKADSEVIQPVALAPLPAGLEASAFRDVVRAALGDELAFDDEPDLAGDPAADVTADAAGPAGTPDESLLTPPSGIPVQRPPAVKPATRQDGAPGYPPSALPPDQAQPTTRLPMQRRQLEAADRLLSARSSGSGGWIGCVVILIFFGVILFGIIRELIQAVS